MIIYLPCTFVANDDLGIMQEGVAFTIGELSLCKK